MILASHRARNGLGQIDYCRVRLWPAAPVSKPAPMAWDEAVSRGRAIRDAAPEPFIDFAGE